MSGNPPLPKGPPPLPKGRPPSASSSQPPLPKGKPPQGARSTARAQPPLPRGPPPSTSLSKPDAPSTSGGDKSIPAAKPTSTSTAAAKTGADRAGGDSRRSQGGAPQLKKFLSFKVFDRSGAVKACKSAIAALDAASRKDLSHVKSASKRKREEESLANGRIQKQALLQHPRAQKSSKLRNSGLRSFHRRTVDAYEIIQQVGAGTFGEVYKARDRVSGDIVALKKTHVHIEKEGFPLTALREIKILQNLRHRNVVHLIEIVPSKASPKDSDLGTVFMVFEYLDNDLTGLMENPSIKLSEAHIKCYMKQLLEGLHYIHTNNVIHRDIKAANLLVSNNGYLKIGDWGLSRSWVPGAKYTTRVVTLWYRAPELLLGDRKYTPAVDLWAVGCIFAELLGKKSILPGKDEIQQLKLILQLCGTPTRSEWPEFKPMLEAKKVVVESHDRSMEKRFSWMHPTALDLLKGLLTLNPTKRYTAADALDHDYFWQGTRPCKPEQLPRIAGDGLHEFELKMKANAERQKTKGRQHHRKGRR